jgi:5-methylcytosine-specific restriction endonuclease McrA
LCVGDALTVKLCNKCFAEYPATTEYFPRNARARDGLRNECKSCKRKISAAQFTANRVAINARIAAKRAIFRDREKENAQRRARRDANLELARQKEAAWREATREEIRSYGRNYDATPSRKAKKEAWREANPDKPRKAVAKYTEANRGICYQRTKEWAKAHPEVMRTHAANRRALKRGAGIHTVEDIAAIRRSQKDRCAYCRAKLNGRGEVDHIKPLSKGGGNTRKNLQMLCASCNRTKHAKDPTDFAREIGLLI